MKKFVLTLAAVLLPLSVAPLGADKHEGGEGNHADGRVFELRTYTTPEGKLPDLLAPFPQPHQPYFREARHEAGGLLDADRRGQGQHLDLHPGARQPRGGQEIMGRVRRGPGWKKAAAESRKDGRLVSKVVSQFLAPTDFSPIH